MPGGRSPLGLSRLGVGYVRRMDREGVTASLSLSLSPFSLNTVVCVLRAATKRSMLHLRIPCSCHCRDTRLECSCPAAPSYSPLVRVRSNVPTRDPWLQQS